MTLSVQILVLHAYFVGLMQWFSIKFRKCGASSGDERHANIKEKQYNIAQIAFH